MSVCRPRATRAAAPTRPACPSDSRPTPVAVRGADPESDLTAALRGAIPLRTWPAVDLSAIRRRLDPLIREYAEAGPDGRVWLRSPWGYQVPLVDLEGANEEVHRRNHLIHEGFAAGDVVGALIHVERPYRLNWLVHEVKLSNLPLLEIAKGVLFTWSDLNRVHNVAADGMRLLRRTGFVADLGEDEMQVTTERPAWLDGELTVYRGASAPEHVGPTWSRDPDVAYAYADQYGDLNPRQPTVFTGVVRAEHVRAYLHADESVIADTRHVRLTTVDSVG
jgi:hypothetical protein